MPLWIPEALVCHGRKTKLGRLVLGEPQNGVCGGRVLYGLSGESGEEIAWVCCSRCRMGYIVDRDSISDREYQNRIRELKWELGQLEPARSVAAISGGLPGLGKR